MASQPSSDNQVADVIALVKAYAQQETVDPIKGLGRYLLFGVLGSLLVGLGVILLSVGLLRVLQTETGDAFDGNWSFVPYVITLLVVVLVAVLAVTAISRGRAKPGATR